MTDIDRLAAVDTCAISDACDRLGVSCVVDGIVPLAGSRRIGGRAITVLLSSTDDVVTSPRHLCTAAIEAAGPSDVIVVAHHGRSDCAGWGGNLSRAARYRRVPGVVVDGAVRDVDEADALGFAVFARSATPRTARGRTAEIAWNVSVEIGGVAVEPGDLVVADASGVVVVPRAEAQDVLRTAEEIASKEARLARLIEGGADVSSVMDGSYEEMLRRTS